MLPSAVSEIGRWGKEPVLHDDLLLPTPARDVGETGMKFLILRILTHSELGMFHEYRRQGKEGSKQRAINFDGDVVDRVFPTARDTDRVAMELRFDTDRWCRLKRAFSDKAGQELAA